MKVEKDVYGLRINLDFDIDYHGDEVVEIAKIVEEPSNSDVMFIFYYKDLYSTANYHLCTGFTEIYEGVNYPIVYVDDEHKDLLYNKPELFQVLMLHELGHYLQGDFRKADNTHNTHEILSDRTRHILSGKVQSQELKADAFAARYMGKNKTIQALDYLIQKRRKRPIDPGKEIAIKEFENRKKAVQRL